VRALRVGAATTFVGAVVLNGQATVLNCGDSGAVLVNDGVVRAATDAHNLGDSLARYSGDPNVGLHLAHIVTSALGAQHEPRLDVERWSVKRGDRLVVVTDGVLDANLAAQREALLDGTPWSESNHDVTAREIAAIVARSASASQATQGLVDYAAEKVTSGAGKRDNVSVVVVLFT
jgi:serine/threonine protein phosphatase PrpC